jgi:hypothetical protein
MTYRLHQSLLLRDPSVILILPQMGFVHVYVFSGTLFQLTSLALGKLQCSRNICESYVLFIYSSANCKLQNSESGFSMHYYRSFYKQTYFTLS